MLVNSSQHEALKYVLNTEGGAKLEHFIDDHEPIGNLLWKELSDAQLVFIDQDQAIKLTPVGHSVLQGMP